MIRIICPILVFVIVAVLPMQGYCETPDEYKVKDAELSIVAAEDYLGKIEEALKDYRDFTDVVLTDKVLNKLKEEKSSATIIVRRSDIKKLKTTDWSIQNIGFINWVIMVRGTLLKSDYLAKKYEYELAKQQKEISDKELSNLRNASTDASEKYRSFLSRIVLVD